MPERRAVAVLYFTQRRWRHRGGIGFLRYGTYYAVNRLDGAESGRTFDIGTLVITLFDVFRQIPAGTDVRGLFAERTVKHNSALHQFSGKLHPSG